VRDPGLRQKMASAALTASAAFDLRDTLGRYRSLVSRYCEPVRQYGVSG
jgi:hypothetical protein